MEKKRSLKPILIGIIILVLTAGIVYAVMSTGGSKKTEKAKTETQNSETSTKDTELKDGEYEGTAKGYGGDITVKVTIKDGKISDIKVVSQNETPGYYENGVKVLDKIIKANSTEVDSIAGATVTSDALKLAVQRALVKAGAKESDTAKKIEEHKNNILNAERKARARRGGGGLIAGIGGGGRGYFPKNSKFRDGTYTGTSRGYNGPIKVSVTIRNGKIASVSILNHHEDYPYFGWAKRVLNRIIGTDSANVNTVSGATYSSRGIINAINNALSKAVYTPDEVGKGKGNNHGGSTKPGNKDQDDEDDNANKPNKPSTPEEKTELEKIKEATNKMIAALTRKGQLKEGTFDGEGGGFNTTKGNIKTKTTIADNKIKDITVADGDDYADDITGYRSKAIRVLPFLKDEKNGRENIAVMKLYRDYVEKIQKAKDQKATAEKLIGKKHADLIYNYANVEHVSRGVKSYFSQEHAKKDMFDAVTGATVSAGGIGRSVDNAVEKSENDAKTGNTITAIEVVEPADSVNPYTKKIMLRANSKKPLDLSELKVALRKEDGSEIKVAYADFDKYGIEIKDKQTGEKLTHGMDISKFAAKGAMTAVISHKESKRTVEMAIWFGAYSKDYVKEMEYSLDDGKTWKKVENPILSDENKNNIADRQTVKLPKSYLGKNIKFRTKTISGAIYNYESKEGMQYKKIKFDCVTESYKDNANVGFALFITFEEDKTATPQPPAPGGNEGTEAGAGDIDVTMPAGGVLNHQKIADIPVTAGSGVTLESAEGLPNGLKLEGNKITGTPEIADGEFADGVQKVYKVKIKGKKDGKTIFRTVDLLALQDKDRDGISANDEGVKGDNEFTPKFSTLFITKKLNDQAPTLDEYKALVQNLPKDDSVTVEVVNQPNMSKAGPNRVQLKFKSKYVDGIGKKTVLVTVK